MHLNLSFYIFLSIMSVNLLIYFIDGNFASPLHLCLRMLKNSKNDSFGVLFEKK